MQKKIIISAMVGFVVVSAGVYAVLQKTPKTLSNIKKMPKQEDAIAAQSTCNAIGSDWELANTVTLTTYSKSNPTADIAITADLMPGGLFNSVDLSAGKSEPVPNWMELSVYCVPATEQLKKN